MAVVKFTPRSYFNVAQEHLGRSADLIREQQYYASHYFSGIAVESILRSLIDSEGEQFDSSHSVEYWGKKGSYSLGKSDASKEILNASLDEINKRWRSKHRYFTEKMLDSYLESTKLDKIRGDRVKYSSKRLYALADIIVRLGVDVWNSNKKSRKY